MSDRYDNRTECEKKKEFDSYIFRLLELIENMEQVKDGEYKESCDIFMALRKLFQETRIKIINTPVFQTMRLRAVRNISNCKYISELDKVYDDNYEKCIRCSSFILKGGRNMETHMKRKKCVMNHEAKFQSIKIGEVKDERIANRMIYASAFTFTLKKVKKVGDLDKNSRYRIFPHLDLNEYERFNLTEEQQTLLIKQRKENQLWKVYYDCNTRYADNQEEIDWFKDKNGNWRENGKN
jgi:hypothetical protein